MRNPAANAKLLLIFALLAGLLAGFLAPARAEAQGNRFAPAADWRERRTTSFALLYVAGEEARAEEYAAFVDGIYDEVSTIFGFKTATPVMLRLYPTMELYYQANPQARNVQGVVAHANSGRREISIAVPQTLNQTPDEVQNNVRHELSHLVIADMSNDRLNAFFHEGIAQYVERPSGELEQKVVLLRQAIDQGQLLRWRDFDDRQAVYGQPQLAYPQSLSVVAFLVERFGFASIRTFLETYARSSGYRSALERTYQVSPDTLEDDWRAWLPSFIEGGYRRNALTAYDLSPIQALLGQARYDEAIAQLDDAIEWLGQTEQRDTLAQAEALREQARDGQRAQQMAVAAREALVAADYTRAQELIEQARRGYGLVGDTRQNAILDAYAERAARGLEAERRLDEARSLARALRYPQARDLIDGVVSEFQVLGDSTRAAQAEALRRTLDARQLLVGYAFLLLGLLGVLASLWQRLGRAPREVW
jgi:hypothetical protein